MDSERYRKATDLFLEAGALAADQRASWLDEVCAGDAEMRRCVEEMLAAEASAAGFLESPAAVGRAPIEEPVPAHIGPFRVLALLGRGGMGTVYEAEQETPRRRVAVKVMQPGALNRALIGRFRYEAELLGRLQHQGIAQVYAAGTEETDAGPRPWLAMEIVRGLPLDEHAREHELDLVARVGDAMHHAHQRGVVHRDLKPANVLVDAGGNPKVLDFGVARAAEAQVRATLVTEPGLIVGTLQTMSPEQAAASSDIDARTDVYSLGAIAYELLAGRPAVELAGLPLASALRKLSEDEPTRLGAIDRRLAGDVEVVVAKALAKDRDRRYASAAAFAADLRRVVRGEPVEARPPSSIYLLTKLARRHRGLVAGVALALITGAAGLLAFALQSRSKAAAERRASEEARASSAIDRYLLHDLLAAPDPRERGRDVRVVDVLKRASAGAEEAFADQPQVLARVRATLGKTFLALDELELAEAETRAALGFAREHFGARAPHTLELEGTLVELLTVQGRSDEGLPLARAALERQREALGRDHETTLTTATNLATLLLRTGVLKEAEELLLDVIERRDRTLGPDDTASLLAHENLSAVLTAQGRFDEAIQGRTTALERRRARFGDADPSTLLARLHHAMALHGAGRLADPAGTFEELLVAMRATWGERHHQTSEAMLRLAVALEAAGRSEEAFELYEQVAELRDETLGPTHDATLEAHLALAQALARLSLFEQAAELAERCLAGRERSTGNPLLLGLLMLTAGEIRLAAGDDERARDHLRAALEVLEALDEPAAGDYAVRARVALSRLPRED